MGRRSCPGLERGKGGDANGRTRGPGHPLRAPPLGAAGAARRRSSGVIGLVEVAEDLVHYAVARLLVAVAGVVLVKSVLDLIEGHRPFAELVTDVLNSILLVIIVMEILRTVIAHFDDAGLQLKPFLIIGIISAVRHILTVGAQASLGVSEHGKGFNHAQVELGVNAMVVILLVVGLVLVWRSERLTPTSAETNNTRVLS